MITTTLAIAVAVLTVGLTAAFVLHQRQQAKYARLPPGPKPKWPVGTPVPEKYPWRYYYELSKTYGPLITVWQGTKPSVICSNVATADFFLEKNARDTADRPRQIAGDEILSHGMRILLVGHNERWRRLRKALHQPLQPTAAREVRPVQESAARDVISDILEDPKAFQSQISTYAATLVVHMAYGRTDRARYSDEDIKEVAEGARRLGTTLRPGAFKVEAFPILRCYLKQVNTWAEEELSLFRRSMYAARDAIAEHKAAPCFATYLFEKQKSLGLKDDEIAYLLGSVFGAGSDTSSSAITICVMAAAVYPDAQRRVQEELDRVVGRERLPTWDDFDDMPVLRAFVAESFRWRPVSSGGFQHRTTSDIVYGDYVIPAGTAITGNHWAIHRDEEYYGPKVDEFDLDRWLLPSGESKTSQSLKNDQKSEFNTSSLKNDQKSEFNTNTSLKDDQKLEFNTSLKNYQFGFGRRICPGQHVALNSVLINAALMLWAFEIGKAKDEHGNEVEIDTLAFTNTANSHPLPFQAEFRPRIEGIREIIQQEKAVAL